MDAKPMETPLRDHVRSALEMMERGARMRLDDMPGDTSMLSASFGHGVGPAIAAEITALRARVAGLEGENADLKTSVIAFGAPFMVRYAESYGLPDGHLFPNHYDILKAAGARMDSFTRADLQETPDGR